MKVEYKTKKLENQYRKHKEAVKAYGAEIGRKYIQRINIIKASKNIDALKKLPGLRCHPLKGDLKGYWAIKLTGFWRLIFTIHGDRLEIARIEEVSKHYGD